MCIRDRGTLQGLANEIFIRQCHQHWPAGSNELIAAPQQFQAMEGIFSEIMSGIDKNFVLWDPTRYCTFGQGCGLLNDIGNHIVIVNPVWPGTGCINPRVRADISHLVCPSNLD